MSEGITQALIRAVRVFVVAGLGALGLDATNIVQIGTGGDVITGPLVLSVVVAAIEAILKAIGGATTPLADSGVRGAGDRASTKRPNPFAI